METVPRELIVKEDPGAAKFARCMGLALRLTSFGLLGMSFPEWCKWFSEYVGNTSLDVEERLNKVERRLIEKATEAGITIKDVPT